MKQGWALIIGPNELFISNDESQSAHTHIARKKIVSSHHRHFSSGAQLISINFYSCNAGPNEEKMRSEKIKAKETARTAPRVQLIFLVSFFRGGWRKAEERNLWTSRKKWLKFQKMFIWWGRVCDVTNFYNPISPFNSLARFLGRRLNRQILITWQSSSDLIGANPFSGGSRTHERGERERRMSRAG